MDKVELIANDDQYQIFINGVEIKNVKRLNINKQSSDVSEVSIIFDCKVKTRERGRTWCKQLPQTP